MQTVDTSANTKTTRKRKLIDSLAALSIEEKQTVISFFSRHPNYENLIDWNNRNLTYGDFQAVFDRTCQSKAARKRQPREDVSALFEGQNCVIIDRTEEYVLAAPLDWECAVYFSSSACGGERGKWCIGREDDKSHWDSYSREASLFFVYFLRKHPVLGKKLVILHDTEENNWQFFRQENKSFWLLPLLTDGLHAHSVPNPFNVCWQLWCEYLRNQRAQSGQLYFDFDMWDCPEASAETVIGAAFIKKALPLLLHDGITFPHSNNRVANDTKQMDFLNELTGEVPESQLLLKYALFLRHHGYEYRIGQYNNIFFFIDGQEHYIYMHDADLQFAAFYNCLGDGCCKRGDFDRAVEEYSQAITLNPARDEYYLSRGVMYNSTCRNDLAISDFTEAIRLDPEGMPIYYYFRGIIYYEEGCYDEALADIKKALSIEPNHVEAKKMLQRLQAMRVVDNNNELVTK